MSTNNQRFLALDVFRGLTICFMIIVNTPGNGATTFSPLLHANWHGFTPTDLVFPSFLFAVGNAMSFVMLKWENKSASEVIWKILKRTIIISDQVDTGNMYINIVWNRKIMHFPEVMRTAINHRCRYHSIFYNKLVAVNVF